MAASTATRKCSSAGRVRAARAMRPERWGRWPASCAGVAATTALLLAPLGCGKDTAAPPTLTAAQVYWSLGLNQHAVMLALQSPYDTVQLTATPRNAVGAPLTVSGTMTYRALDTMVTVSSTGLVTARHLASVDNPVHVVVSLQDPTQGITHTDTARIAVTATPLPALTTYSMQPVPGDSAKRSLDYPDPQRPGFAWPVRVVDANGDTVCNDQQCALLVYYQTSKPAVARIDPITASVKTNDTGHVVFTAQTLAYGRVLQDSVAFQVGYRAYYIVLLTLVALGGSVLGVVFRAPRRLILGVGALVTFCNPPTTRGPASRPIDIVFDHPEAVDSGGCGLVGLGSLPPTGSGNIPAFGGDTTVPPGLPANPGNVACRRFHTPGVYRYHSTLFPSDTYEIEIKQDPQ